MGFQEVGRRGVGAIEERQPIGGISLGSNIEYERSMQGVRTRVSLCSVQWVSGPASPSGAESLKGRKCFCVHLIVSTAWQRTGLEADAQEILA